MLRENEQLEGTREEESDAGRGEGGREVKGRVGKGWEGVEKVRDGEGRDEMQRKGKEGKG